MKELRIDIKKVLPQTGSKWVNFPIIGLLLLLGLCLLPLLVLFWIVGMLYNLLAPSKIIQNENNWKSLITGTELIIRYKWAEIDDMPDFIYQFSIPQPSLIFDSQPNLRFFDGYFTDLKIERSDGVFLQKIIYNEEKKEIIALPLYFFNYATHEIKEIMDLKGHELDTKGTPDDFIISAIGEERELQIRLRKE